MLGFTSIHVNFPLLSRLVQIGLDETWLKDYKQKIMINGDVPSWLGSGERGREVYNSLV